MVKSHFPTRRRILFCGFAQEPGATGNTSRRVYAQVLGKPVKICVRLDEQEVEARAERPNARERAERDQAVEAFRKKFDGTVLDVKDLSRE